MIPIHATTVSSVSVSCRATVRLANINSTELIKKLNMFSFAECVGQTEAKTCGARKKTVSLP